MPRNSDIFRNNRIRILRINPNNLSRNQLLRGQLNLNSDFLLVERQEPNWRFLLGFLIGLFLGLYSLIILACCNLRPKFKAGLKVGMLIGTFIFLVYNITHPNARYL